MRGRVALARARIPYRVVGGTRFFDRAEVKDCLAYLAVAVNPNDTGTCPRRRVPPPQPMQLTLFAYVCVRLSLCVCLFLCWPAVAFDRAVNTPPREVGEKTLEQLHVGAAQAQLPLVTYVRGVLQGRCARPPGLTRLPATSLQAFVDIITTLETLVSAVCTPTPIVTHTQRERERHTHRERETRTHRERETRTHTHTHRRTHTHTHRRTHTHTHDTPWISHTIS
jgi:superfamily I DNA/RNA helicase